MTETSDERVERLVLARLTVDGWATARAVADDHAKARGIVRLPDGRTARTRALKKASEQ